MDTMSDFVYDDSIENCELRYRCAEILMAHGFKSILELAHKTDAEILSLKGIGKSSLNDIRMVIAAIEKERGAKVH
jgi:DNA-directed RNA polymerase alpha subunit